MTSFDNDVRQRDEALDFRIRTLQLAYAHCIDDGELERWPEFFTDPCLYRAVSRENVEQGLELGLLRFESVGMLRDRVTATRHAALFAPRHVRHILSSTLIDSRGPEGIRTRTNVAIYQTSADGDTLLLVAAQYRDLIVEVGGELRFRERHIIYDTARLPDTVIYPL